MRMINTKVPVKKSNLKVILDFTKAICLQFTSTEIKI